MKKRIVVVGGGFAGCAAAASAADAQTEVTLLERTDMLLGTGLVGGIMHNNGRDTAAKEMEALGAGALFSIADRCARHRNIIFPGHEHATLFDAARMPQMVQAYLEEKKVNIIRNARISAVKQEQNTLLEVKDDQGRIFAGEAFIDATGTAGPMPLCKKYGNGCAMCVLRCPSFGGRISVTALCGVAEKMGIRQNGERGAMSGSCILEKASLSGSIQRTLAEKGVAIVEIPKEEIEDHRTWKACQQYTESAYRDNLILLDTGEAKLMTPFFPLHKLRKIPGFERARFFDPYAGGQGNSMRFFAMAPREDTLQVKGINNLFCAGEKAGLFVGHTEAIVTGSLAGYNARKLVQGEPLFILPRSLAAGEAISYVREEMEKEKGMEKKYTFSGADLFTHIKEKGLYETRQEEIDKRVQEMGLFQIFCR